MRDKVIKIAKILLGVAGVFMAGAKILAIVPKNHEYDEHNETVLQKKTPVNKTFYEKYVKRMLDVLLSFLGLIILAPIFAFISLAIFIDDPGPVLFTQKRVGINKTHFKLHKFRSMKMSTPHDTPTHLLENPDQYILRTGKWIRKYSLDELPQIWDIFIGNMTIIGPRPALWNQYDLIAERDKYGANDVKPGLTGWAQINGRDELEIEVKAKLDGEYTEKLQKNSLAGVLMDIKCFWGTIFSVAKAEGVYEGGTGELKSQKDANSDGLAGDEAKTKKKVLFVATVVRLHINMFHKPFLQWFHEQGWQVDVAANNDYENPDECIIPNCDNFYCLPFERSPLKIGNLKAFFQLKKIIDSGEYDIIHCHTPMGGVIARMAAARARKRGTKVIYTAHGFHFYKGASLVNWLVYYPVEKLLANVTDLIITMNKEDYENAKKMKAKKVAIVNGVGLDLNKFKVCTLEEKEEIRKELQLKTDDIFGISVAQLIPRKNHIVLIKAVAELDDPAFHLFIVGDGAQGEELKNEAKCLGVSEQIHFLGFRNDVYRLCSAADLFLFASRQEGLPVAVMEAMACGKPIIASKIRGNVDLIDQEKGGFLVKANDVDGFVDCIKEALSNTDKLSEMEGYNLRKIQEYSIENVLKQMSTLYVNFFEENK